jgi:hypothetical protein
LEPRELVLNLLARPFVRAAHEHLHHELRVAADAFQAVLVAVVQADDGVDGVAARFLRQHDELDAVRQLDARRARVDVLGRRVECLAFGTCLVARVALQHLRDVGPLRNLGSVRLAGDERADGPVRGFQIGERGTLHVGHGRLADAVAVEEHQAPIADRRPIAELHGDRLRVVHLLFEAR